MSAINKLIDDACGYKPEKSIQQDMEIVEALKDVADAATTWDGYDSVNNLKKLRAAANRLRLLGWDGSQQEVESGE